MTPTIQPMTRAERRAYTRAVNRGNAILIAVLYPTVAVLVAVFLHI